MNTTNAAVGTGAIVVLGQWSEGKGISVRIVVGVVVLALALAVLPERLAVPFAWLILVAISFRYAPGIIQRSGIAAGTNASSGTNTKPYPGIGPAIGV